MAQDKLSVSNSKCIFVEDVTGTDLSCSEPCKRSSIFWISPFAKGPNMASLLPKCAEEKYS